MSEKFRLPNITPGSTNDQLRQMKSFLKQHVQQLNWTVSQLEGGTGQNQVNYGGGTGKTSGGSTADKTPVATFNDIKSLIIKSADIVNAYYEQINAKLKGEYLAQSDFGTYKEQTAMEIQGNSEEIKQVYENVQSLESDVAEIQSARIETDAYIKTGLLDYGNDGAAIYGLEIGQTNTVDGEATFSKFARFTSDRLSFYDGSGIEIAYISDYKLHITSATITGSLFVGGYEMNTEDGVVFEWVGG